jgi:glutamyl-tRNA synthetase
LEKYIEWETASVSDATLLKSDGFPTYHLAVVVDDTDMNISHALRGHDWMPSTPIHLLVYKYLGYKMPELGHLSDIQDPGGGKLSKRKGSLSCEAMIAEGYLPEAILNFVILLGWAPKDNQEIFSLSEFVKSFDSKGFQKANPVFNRQKLDWFNGVYIRNLSDAEVCSKFELLNPKFKTIKESSKIQITKLIKERISKLSDFNSMAGFFLEQPKVDISLFGPDYKKHLELAKSVIETQENWKLEDLNSVLMDKIKASGFKVGDFFMSLRIALTGSKFTPPINDSIIILGKEETITRLRSVLT